MSFYFLDALENSVALKLCSFAKLFDVLAISKSQKITTYFWTNHGVISA